MLVDNICVLPPITSQMSLCHYMKSNGQRCDEWADILKFVDTEHFLYREISNIPLCSMHCDRVQKLALGRNWFVGKEQRNWAILRKCLDSKEMHLIIKQTCGHITNQGKICGRKREKGMTVCGIHERQKKLHSAVGRDWYYMIAEAIMHLRKPGKWQVSRQSITKYICANHDVTDDACRVYLPKYLKKGLISGRLVKVKASYKLSKDYIKMHKRLRRASTQSERKMWRSVQSK